MSSSNGKVAPAQYPPPVDPVAEFVTAPVDPEDERIDVGVAIVGGGTAGLACANRLLQLVESDPEVAERLGEVPVAVIEKGKVCGAHQLSGGVMRPGPLRDLFPDIDESDWPVQAKIDGKDVGEAVYVVPNGKRAIRIPTPPPFKNHGNYVVSVAELARFMAEKAEEAGAYLLTETVAQQLIVEDDRVIGIRTGDKGRDKESRPKSNFEPGSDVTAKATVLADGVWGHLTGAAIPRFDLAADSDPQVWALGVKEVWKVPNALEKIIHTMGWPLRFGAKYKEFGGSFIYPMADNQVTVGFVVGLDWADARFSVHDVLQEFKCHPLVRKILEGGERVTWGAKAIPEGGYWAMPKLAMPGAVICGDAGGMLNVAELKGIHYGILSGSIAAEHIFRALKAGEEQLDLSGYNDAIHESEIGRDMRRTRNMKQPFAKGFFVGGAIVNAMTATNGAFPGGHWETHPDAEQPLIRTGREKSYPKPDGKYTFDKLSGVFLTGNATRDDAPSHIRVQQRVPREVADAWAYMCPAGVYEVPDDAPEEGEVEMIVNPSNCVQCGAITAKGGRLTPPEGGDGPLYQIT